MTRSALAFLLLLLAWAAPAPASETVTLKAQVLVQGEVVRLGDLFDGVGEKADVTVAHAPQPGRRMVLDSRWLSNVARAYGLNWRPLSHYDRVTIERDSVLVPMDRIEAELQAALHAAGVKGDMRFEMVPRTVELRIPAGQEPTVAVRDFSYDARAARFSALLEAPAESSGATRLRVAGRVFTVTEVPVLVRPLSKGEIITEADLQWIEIKDAVLRHGAVIDAGELIGKAARQYLRAGVPLRAAEVQRPVVVARGSTVTMVMEQGRLRLTAQGRAEEDGGLGETIRVVNTHTKATVEAKVQGPGLVVVVPGNHILAN